MPEASRDWVDRLFDFVDTHRKGAIFATAIGALLAVSGILSWPDTVTSQVSAMKWMLTGQVGRGLMVLAGMLVWTTYWVVWPWFSNSRTRAVVSGMCGEIERVPEVCPSTRPIDWIITAGTFVKRVRDAGGFDHNSSAEIIIDNAFKKGLFVQMGDKGSGTQPVTMGEYQSFYCAWILASKQAGTESPVMTTDDDSVRRGCREIAEYIRHQNGIRSQGRAPSGDRGRALAARSNPPSIAQSNDDGKSPEVGTLAGQSTAA